MTPIDQFPYENKNNDLQHPMHERMLLLQMKVNLGVSFAVGFYNAVDDVFCVCTGSFQQTKGHRYDERPAGGNYANHEKYKDREKENPELFSDTYCIMPKGFSRAMGSRRIISYMPMDEALTFMTEHDLFDWNVPNILKKPHYSTPYLLWTVDDRVLVANIGAFVGSGPQFSACSPVKFREGDVRHGYGPVPVKTILCVANLEDFLEVCANE